MSIPKDVLKFEEKAIMELRALYKRSGYSHYKMSKFEEYELYAHNRAFLAADDIITFTDSGGRLMALRPDVTLSIVKNLKVLPNVTKKLYYNENVYRSGGDDREFKEQMQAGLECIGDIDLYSMCEVITLADLSLKTFGRRHRIDISHMGFLSGMLADCDLSDSLADEIAVCISEKNAPQLEKLCDTHGLACAFKERIVTLASLYGPFETAVGTLREISTNEKTDEALKELEDIFDVLTTTGAAENLYIDFSVINDMNYYNGIIFQGFVDGVPSAVLFGGRYDSLLQKFGKSSGAIGFAVYLDLLERLYEDNAENEVDALLIYDGAASAKQVAEAVKKLSEAYKSVKAVCGDTAGITYKKQFSFKDGRLDELA